jgi:hypothetical protein
MKRDMTDVIPYGCYKCVFRAECKHNIWKASFDPYCFVDAKYHGLYVAEYAP